MRTFGILVGGWVVGGLVIVTMAFLLPAGAPASAAPVTANPAEYAFSGPSSSGLLIPVAGMTAERLHDSFNEGRTGHVHHALDILAPRGTPVLAATDGTVKKLFTSGAGGTTIYEFDRAEQRVYYYAHLDRYANGLHEGQQVRQGEVIGYVGTTGNAPPGTPHLHFAIESLTPEKLWWKGEAINPYPLLAR